MSIAHQLKLTEASFLLHHDRTGSNFRTHNQGTGLYPNEVAAAQLAVDCKIEQCAITHWLDHRGKSGSPKFVPRLERTFCPNLLACMPRALV